MTSIQPHARRTLLAVVPKPATAMIAVSTFVITLDDGRTITLAYVPDALVLTREGFVAYVTAPVTALGLASGPLETAAAIIAEDVANELVLKWMHLRLSHTGDDGLTHGVAIEDRQPGWDHPAVPRHL